MAVVKRIGDGKENAVHQEVVAKVGEENQGEEGNQGGEESE